MKKAIISGFIALALLAPAAVFGQNLWLLSSQQSDWSDGLFDNELGAALTPVERTSGPNFADLNRFYLFTGTANLQRATNTGATAGTLLNPLLFGAFVPGDMPFSVFSGLHVVGGGPAPAATVVTGTQPETVGTTVHEWVDTRTTTDARVPSLDNANLQLQYLTRFGDITGGVFLMWRLDDQRANTVVTESVFVNTALAGEVPVPTLQSEVTTTTDNRGGTMNRISMAFPLFLRTGELGHSITPNFGFTSTNSSTSTEYEIGTLAGTAATGPFDEGFVTLKDVSRTVAGGTTYELLMPGMFGDNERNQVSVGGSLGLELRGRSFAAETEIAEYSYDGTARVDEGTDDIKQTREYNGGFGFSLNAFAGQSFYHDLPNNVTFAFNPRLTIGYSQDAQAPRETQRVVTTVITDAAGTTTDNEAVTTTTEYANRNSDRTITTAFRLPVAIKAQPEGWLFGFTLSGTPSASYRVDIDTAYSDQLSERSVRTVDNIANTDVTNTTLFADDGYTRTVTHTWTFSANYEFGIHVPLAESVMLDIRLGNNLLDFNALTVQAIVGL